MIFNVEDLIRLFDAIILTQPSIVGETLTGLNSLMRKFGNTIKKEDLDILAPYFVGELAPLGYAVEQIITVSSKRNEERVILSDAEIKAYTRLTLCYISNNERFERIDRM